MYQSKTSIAWVSLLLLCLLVGCGCPDDTPLGDLFLDDNMRAQVPYRGDEVLQFVSDGGDTLLLQSVTGLEEDSIHLNVAQQCAEDLFDVQHLFYHSNQWRLHFESRQDPAKYLTLEWRLVPIDTAGDAAVPAHLVGYLTVDSWLMDYGMKLIVDDRGTVLPPEATYYQHASYVADTTLGTRQFEALYMTKGGDGHPYASIFYQPQRGVVAMQEASGPLWLLDDRPTRSLYLGEGIDSVISLADLPALADR